MFFPQSEVSLRVASLPLMRQNRSVAAFHKPKNLLPFGLTKRENSAVSRLSLYTKLRLLQPYAIHRFTNIWF